MDPLLQEGWAAGLPSDLLSEGDSGVGVEVVLWEEGEKGPV